MATLTPNRSYSKPDVGGDKDVWGTQLNTGTIDKLDVDVQQALDDAAGAPDLAKQAYIDLINLQEPIGTIKMIATGAAVPAGWNECDGTNGTPDARERVPVCVAPANVARARGSKFWSQNTASNGTQAGGGLTPSGTVTVDNHTGNTGNTVLTQGQLPDATLQSDGTFLTTRNTGDLAFDTGGGGQNVYREKVDSPTGGASAGHNHTMNHGHTASFAGNAVADHNHVFVYSVGATYGVRWIMKIRDLTLSDYP